MMRCCFDKRVWIGLGVLAAGLLVVNPHIGWAALPVLVGLACPVLMLFMMRRMRHPAGSVPAAPGGEPGAGDGTARADHAAEIARLHNELRQLKLKARAGDTPAAAEGEAPAAGARRTAG